MSDVVFITPNISGSLSGESFGTLLLATILRDAGIQSKIFSLRSLGDLDHFDTFIRDTLQKISALNPKIVSFYSRSDTYHIALKIAQYIKKTSPHIYTVFGGPHSDLVAEDTLTDIPYVDYICRGEGEHTIVPFFNSLIAGKPDHTIAGLVYRENGAVVTNPKPELIANLDSLPFVDYSFLDSQNTYAHSTQESFSVDVGRGCPFSCTFCSTKMFWGQKYRLKSAERIVEEIKNIHDKFGFTSFTFEHDMFTLNREKVIQICAMLKNIGFDLTWQCSARIDCLDEELIDIMADAGLTKIFVGIETGSARMQKVIRKNLNLNKVVDILTYISNKGLHFTASFIFGYPNETEEDFSQTMALMMKLSKLPRSHVQQHLYAFFAGTELTNQYIGQLEPSTILPDATVNVFVPECEDLIFAHPALFSHFFEYKNELREKVKYYPTFFRCWLTMQPVYEYIAARYYSERLCQMLYDFSERNRDVLLADAGVDAVLRQDQFLDAFADDERYAVLKDVARFILWRNKAEDGSTEVFKFNVQDFLNGSPIEKLRASFAVVKCARAKTGDRKFTIYGPT